MMYIKYLIWIMLSLILINCSRSQEQSIYDSPDKIYLFAHKKLQEGKWKQAIAKLKILDNLYPFGLYSHYVQLDLIYAYYKNSDFELAKSLIDRFIRLNPMHSNIDYVIYIRGLINMTLDSSILYNLFKIDNFDREPKYAKDAFKDFSKIIQNYPNSQYSADATKRLIFLKNRLAKHEYSIAKYYASRGAWIAVVNRVKDMLHDYPDTQATRNGLKLMKNAYCQMNLKKQADKVAKIIAFNK